MTFTLTISLDNDDFADAMPQALAYLLTRFCERELSAVDTLAPGDAGTFRDRNGNTVGTFEVTE